MVLAVRYMAPEVALNEPYDLRADVYSWSIVFWYILALEPPLSVYPPTVFVSHVAIDGKRPVLHKQWSTSVRRILETSWHQNPRQRPYFDTILTCLLEIIHQIAPEVGLTINNMSIDSLKT
jgi:Protein tyrosine and serine/threonine kinase